MKYDVVIVGASFAGITLALHLDKNLKVLILDRKKSLDSYVESTGLITQDTKDLIDSFFDTEPFIPNKINTICVVSTDFKKHFFSHTNTPWIYSTDTPNLIKSMAENLGDNVDIKLDTEFLKYNKTDKTLQIKEKGKEKYIITSFLVGADGANSSVASAITTLSKNTKFLTGLEKVFYGKINLGKHCENTIYHFWFGDFSLGYGGWISPTIINGKSAIRLGLAKHLKDTKNISIIYDFIKRLKDEKIIKLDEEKEILSFASQIPLSGVLKNYYSDNTLLIGDAAGYCGAFAADGIKGAVLSGQIAAYKIKDFLNGKKSAFDDFHSEMQKHNKLISYYKKQVFYRFVWDLMKSNRSFDLLFELCRQDSENFIKQFCDSKDKNKSLISTVLTFKNIPLVVKYSFSLLLDMFKEN